MPPEENLDDLNMHYSVTGEYVFKEGETFDNYEELMHRMELHTKESLVYYWKRDSRSVEKAYTKTSRPIASKLKFYLVRFACVYGGMRFQPRGIGRRVGQSFRTNCPAHIQLRASKCGQKLEVITVCNNHNHEISEKALELLPQNRKLPKDIKDEVVEMLKIKIDKKKIIEYVRQRINKRIKLKDLFNLTAKLKSSSAPQNEDSRSPEILQNIFNCTKDRSIQAAIHAKLHPMDPDSTNMYYSEEEDNEIIEYISPEGEFCVNETIIESIVKVGKEEIDQWEDETLRELEGDDMYAIKSEINTNIEVDKIDFDESMMMIEDGKFEVDELMTNKIEIDEQNFESIDPSTVEIDCKVEEEGNVVLFEITAEKFAEKSEQKANFHSTKTSHLKSGVMKNIKRTVKCRKCGTNSKLLQSQIRYLKARRDKLLAETNVLVMKKRKLKMEIEILNDSRQ